jgi:hypothetical protein
MTTHRGIGLVDESLVLVEESDEVEEVRRLPVREPLPVRGSERGAGAGEAPVEAVDAADLLACDIA